MNPEDLLFTNKFVAPVKIQDVDPVVQQKFKELQEKKQKQREQQDLQARYATVLEPPTRFPPSQYNINN